MRRILNLISIAGLLLAALGTTRIPFALADCDDGGSGDDVINCTTDPVPGDNDVDGKGGDDTIYVGPDVTEVEDVIGDNTFIGGDDTITVDADADDVVGDDAYWAGDDTITVNGDVSDVVGDGAAYCYDWNDSQSASCNDSITLNGSADNVIGDDVLRCNEDDCNDSITVNGDVSYEVAGDGTYKCDEDACNDDIAINGSAFWVAGDDAGRCDDGSCNDTITVNGGVVYVDGDYADKCEDDSCNDTITINGWAGFVAGEGETGRCEDDSCNDTINVNGLALVVYGDDAWKCEDGSCNDTININGEAIDVFGDGVDWCKKNSCNDTITISGTVSGSVYGDSEGDVKKLGPGLDSIGEFYHHSYNQNNDTIIISGTVFGDVFADDPEEADYFRGEAEGFGYWGRSHRDTVIINSHQEAVVNSTVVCGDISVESVSISENSGNVFGVIDGGQGFDKLYLNYTGYSNAPGINAVNFEKTISNINILEAPSAGGTTRLFDNGVVSTFMGGDGKSIDICYQPEGYGYKVSLVNFDELDRGVRQFAVGSQFMAIVNNDTSTCDPNYTPAGANWKVELYQNGVMVDNHFCFIH